MQITEKDRNDIALSLPSLGKSEVEKIASECGCSTDTVYREWRKIRGLAKGPTHDDNPVVVLLCELAARRKAEAKELRKRLRKSMRQLSAV